MQNDSTPQITPILPSAWDNPILDALGAFPKSLQYVLSNWKDDGSDVRGMNVLGSMAHYPALAKAFMTLNAHVAGASTLTTRVREIAILRIGWLRRAEYEFAQHIILGKRAGLTDADIERIEQGPNVPGWDIAEADVVRAVDDLYVDAGISRATWARLKVHFSDLQIMDLIFLVGCYDMLGTAIKSFNTPLERDLPPLEPGLKTRLMNHTGPSR